jgi:hypothetical protein
MKFEDFDYREYACVGGHVVMRRRGAATLSRLRELGGGAWLRARRVFVHEPAGFFPHLTQTVQYMCT